jgi:hypothetical protein
MNLKALGWSLLSAASLAAQQPLNTQLLTDPGFESGTVAAWLPVVQGTNAAVADFYGGTLVPFAVGQAIGGGTYFLRGNGASVRNQQSVNLAGNAAAVDAGQLDIEVSAELGGTTTDADDAAFIVRFLNQAGQETLSNTLGPATAENRNAETRFVRRAARIQVPAGTRTLLFECRLNGNSSPYLSFLDNASAILRVHQPPQPVPYGVELLQNGGFETGDYTGWSIDDAGFQMGLYGGLNLPSFAFGAQVGGGSYLVHSLVRFDSAASQIVDLRGSIADVDAGLLEVALGGLFGGRVNDVDYSKLTCFFLGQLGQSIGSLEVGLVSPADRYEDLVLLRRSGVAAIPPGTRTLKIEVRLVELTGGFGSSTASLADNLSAVVRLAQPVAPALYGTELLVNRSFELPQTYDPSSDAGWRVADPYVRLDLYGNAGMPPSALAQSIGGGSRLAVATDDFGYSALEQRIDLRGNAAAVDAGLVTVQLAGWFGGRISDPDQAELAAMFRTSLGQVMSESVVGNVTAADRGNVTTLLYRQGAFPVPPGTRSIGVQVRLRAINGNVSLGLADLVSCMLINTAGGVATYPGTGEDLHLFTGVNTAPSGGSANEIKLATGGDLLHLRMDSLGTTFDGYPLFVIADVFTTGSPLPGSLPGIAISPPINFLVYGIGPVWHALQPYGNSYTFLVPPGGSGLSVRVQGVVFSIAAANTLFASTNAHEIRLQ